ncbi:MAG: hypothetical protein FJZ64_03320 [Chlamydiae bacterium]|nr:hypothetical protein [Chlamydiota bacterium]
MLQQFYAQFRRKFGDQMEGESAWSEEWSENPEAPSSEISGLKDFETVRKDLEYELFYIRNEEGKPYFHPDLFRNLKLTAEMETTSEFEEDPLLQVRTMQDRDLQASANQILGECHHATEDFFKITKKLPDHPLAKILSETVFALMLAANPRNLLQNTNNKSSLQYFQDFIGFLRSAMQSSEYQKWIAYPPDAEEKEAHVLLFLTHSLCLALFRHAGGIQQESIGLIHRTMRKGEETKQKEKKHLTKGKTLWEQFLLDDEKYRELLQKFPNGPLFKVLDVVRGEEEKEIGFDPMVQGNFPSRIYQIGWKEHRLDVMRLPAPIHQLFIHKAEITDEFRGFLRALGSMSPKKRHLMINLQDRTSWREFARSRAMENLQKSAELNQQIFVITLPKETDFYYQTNEYLNLNQADDFFKILKDQVLSEECGFFFPSSWKKEEILAFADQVVPVIHELFFEKKATLTRRHREDFIEIFYQFLILKATLYFKPHSISFTCKDAVDTGAAESALFYGFIKLFTEEISSKTEYDFLLWLLYTPALFIRERAIDSERLTRAISVLERLDTCFSDSRKEILKKLSHAFSSEILSSLKASHL